MIQYLAPQHSLERHFFNFKEIVNVQNIICDISYDKTCLNAVCPSGIYANDNCSK
jgi:hypothetical protein